MHKRLLESAALWLCAVILLGLLPGCREKQAALPSGQAGASPNETDYRKLASPALYTQFLGKTVTVRARFLAEWTDIATYRAVGIPTENRMFLNHRAFDYRPSSNGLGSSDAEFPPFVMSADVAFADVILHLHHGESMVVTGRLVPVAHPIDAARCVLEISEIEEK